MFTIFIARSWFLSSSSIKTLQTTPRSGLTLSTGDFLWHSVRSTNQSPPQRVSENMTHHILHQECSEISTGGRINQIFMRYPLIILKLSFQEARILHQPHFLGATQTFLLLRSHLSSQLRSTFGQTGSTQPTVYCLGKWLPGGNNHSSGEPDPTSEPSDSGAICPNCFHLRSTFRLWVLASRGIAAPICN